MLKLASDSRVKTRLTKAQNSRRSEKSGRHERRKKRTPARPMKSANAKQHNKPSRSTGSQPMDSTLKLRSINRTVVALHYLPSATKLQKDIHKASTHNNLVWCIVNKTVKCLQAIPTTPTLHTASKVRSISSVSTRKMTCNS